ncbi:MAG: NAD(P)-dependent oxidoreductase [Synergistaceae bacterium]
MTNKVLGFIGIGVMGSSMAGHLLSAGYELHIYNRSKTRADKLIADGAIWENSVADLAKKCDVIFTIVGFPKDVEKVYLGKDGLVENAKSGAILVDMTTSSPSLARKIYNVAKEKGIGVLDAPVSGGDMGAKNATLTIFVGGDEDIFNEVHPLFEVIGKTIARLGFAGDGQNAKLANQIAIAGTMTGMCESMAFAKSCGLDLELVLKLLSGGAANTWSLTNYAPRILKGDFNPGFFIKHYIKDMKLAEASAEEMDMDLPALSLTRELYEEIAEGGMENLGTQALYALYDPDEIQ